MVVRGSIVSPELGTEANPIVIHIDEDWCHDETDLLGSDADTEILATPEFWETLTGESFTVPADDGEAVGSFSVRAPTRSPVCEHPEDLQPFGQSAPNCFHLDDKALKVTESSLMTRNAIPQEATDQTDTSVGKDLSCGSYDAGSTKRKLSPDEGVSSELRRSERLTKRGGFLSLSAAAIRRGELTRDKQSIKRVIKARAGRSACKRWTCELPVRVSLPLPVWRA